jgi:hypothetical protein
MRSHIISTGQFEPQASHLQNFDDVSYEERVKHIESIALLGLIGENLAIWDPLDNDDAMISVAATPTTIKEASDIILISLHL